MIPINDIFGNHAPLDASVSVFEGSTNTAPSEALPLSTVLQRISTGTYRRYVDHLRHTLSTCGEDVYDRLKRRSSAFTPAGTFSARNGASLALPSGCLNLDIDDLDDVDHARAIIGVDPHLVYMFVSPSGAGLKLGIHVAPYTDAESYRSTWLAVERYLVETYPDLAVNNDNSCKDVSRLCYMSWDPALFTNPDSRAFTPPPAPPPPAPQSPSRPRAYPSSSDAERRQYYADHVIATAIKLLDASIPRTPASNGTRDRQRLKASRLIGGYVAGGILTEAEAMAGIAAAVERNTDKLSRAWRVIARGLAYGESKPITLDDLETDWEQWKKAHPLRPHVTITGYAGHQAPIRGCPLSVVSIQGWTPTPTTIRGWQAQALTPGGPAHD